MMRLIRLLEINLHRMMMLVQTEANLILLDGQCAIRNSLSSEFESQLI